MLLRYFRLSCALLLAFGAAMSAHAQTRGVSRQDPTMLPVWNSEGKVEAALILEPTESSAGARWRFGSNTLSAAFGLDSGDSLGLLCSRQNSIANISSLISACNVAMLDDSAGNDSQRASATAVLGRPSGRLGLSVGSGHDVLPAWLSGGKVSPGRFEQNDLAVFAQKNIGREGYVTIGGTVARARLVPASELVDIPDRWTSRSLSVGGGYGAFSANIIGRVVDAPEQSGKWEGLGLGVTWRTPWSGQLTVGAENIVTRGKNPFAPDSKGDEGTVPYVRYEQDL